MNDWWNDPPEDPEEPEDEEAQPVEDPDPECFEMPDDFAPETLRERCPHGEEWSECNACMVAGDMAYDAARESRR